ncbi:MAG: hypothetical protein ACUVXB_14245 [Bryobacteraceae bacterium]
MRLPGVVSGAGAVASRDLRACHGEAAAFFGFRSVGRARLPPPYVIVWLKRL